MKKVADVGVVEQQEAFQQQDFCRWDGVGDFGAGGIILWVVEAAFGADLDRVAAGEGLNIVHEIFPTQGGGFIPIGVVGQEIEGIALMEVIIEREDGEARAEVVFQRR